MYMYVRPLHIINICIAVDHNYVAELWFVDIATTQTCKHAHQCT